MTAPPSLDELRKQLGSVLQSDPVDLDAVAAISARLLEADPGRVRFSVDAAHLRRLGAELIGRIETALAELVKNAYDADATEVFVHFEDTEAQGSRLLIVDNGSGMTRHQMISGFMRLSTTIKVLEPVSPRFGRTRAGRKGIGRLAAQRLGDRLTVTSQTRELNDAWQLSVQWSAFREGMELSEVGSVLKDLPKEREQGTTLEISALDQKWSAAAVREMARQLREVVLDQSIDTARKGYETDPGMRVYVQHGSGPRMDVQSFLEQDLERLALARVEGVIDEAGHVVWRLESSRLAIDDKYSDVVNREGKPIIAPSLRNVRFHALYFVYDRGLLPPKELTRLRDLAGRSGGIRLYRNGFRVLPYGEPGDDWLELDALARQRVVLPPIANINWFGHVAIEDREGEQFQETTSREGLIQNEAVSELRLVLRHVLESSVKRVASMRGRKQRASDQGAGPRYDLVFSSASALHEQLQELANEFRESVPEFLSPRLDLALGLAERTRDAASGDRAETQRLLDEMAMLRVLASFGIVAGEFTHEARLHIQALDVAVSRLESAQSGQELYEAAQRVRPALQPLRALLRYFERAFGEQARRETKVLELRDVIRAFHETISPDLERRAIEFSEQFASGALFTAPMHESEWTAILFNLYTNAKKALNRKNDARRLLLRAGRSGSELFLDFSDTGDGIPDAMRDKVFEPFFTTTAEASGEEDDIVGLGLGLAILRDIVEGYGGRVAAVDPPAGYATTVRMWIPSAKQEEIPADAY